MSINMDAVWESMISACSYLPKTIELVLIPLLFGIVLGTLIALIRVYRYLFCHNSFPVLFLYIRGFRLL